MDTENATTWLALVVSLPTQNATVRMRLWRAVKAGGCSVLRDGAVINYGFGMPDAVAKIVAVRGDTGWAVLEADSRGHLIAVLTAWA